MAGGSAPQGGPPVPRYFQPGPDGRRPRSRWFAEPTAEGWLGSKGHPGTAPGPAGGLRAGRGGPPREPGQLLGSRISSAAEPSRCCRGSPSARPSRARFPGRPGAGNSLQPLCGVNPCRAEGNRERLGLAGWPCPALRADSGRGGCAAPRGQRPPAPRYAPAPRCAADAWQRSTCPARTGSAEACGGAGSGPENTAQLCDSCGAAARARS